MKIIKIKKICGICEKESEQQVILSKSKFNNVAHLDLRSDDGTIDIPLETCPYCFYANFDISGKTNLTPEDIKLEYEKLKIYSERCQKYILSGFVNEKLGNKKDAGIAYLAASWLFEDSQDLRNAEIYRRKACDMLLEQALREEDVYKIMQCIDLCRKNGEFQDVYKLLDMLKNNADEEVAVDESIKENDEYKMIENFINFEKTRCSLDDRKDYLLTDINNKINFIDFNCLFLRRSQFDKVECSIYAPIFYKMKEEYFNAVVECLNTGKCTELSFGEFNTTDIIRGYRLENNEKSYLKAIIILNNIEQFGKEGFVIFNPHIIE